MSGAAAAAAKGFFLGALGFATATFFLGEALEAPRGPAPAALGRLFRAAGADDSAAADGPEVLPRPTTTNLLIRDEFEVTF